MPRPANLSKLSVDALIKMRDAISGILSSKAALLRKELAYLGEKVKDAGHSMIGSSRGTLAGTKVPPKYEGPNGELWAGRGGEPAWMRDAIKNGKTRESFLIDKSAMLAKMNGAKGAKKAKRGRPKKKGT